MTVAHPYWCQGWFAAGRGNRSAVEILFPLTSKVESIPKWTVDGILEYMQSETCRQQEAVGNFKELYVSKDSASLKKELPEVTPEANKKTAEAKSRGTNAFKRKDYQMAIDAYTQVTSPKEADGRLYRIEIVSSSFLKVACCSN
ncbi:ankyrin-1 [Pyrus ussuriensis x Pyrus communis]|uniref:Ankyrin-1 n=1 Tax=Pyrus ussuriensis x Pyrus communis TaxID=2448454 RepID=A0A5N5HPM6_9ROSA|nr:ankyrin-1 [Pyrus ussuriensis x Pyrus communis]